MFLPLLYVTLLMQLGSVAPEQPEVELEIRRRELRLLNFPLDRTALRTLSVWDNRTDDLRDARPGESVDDSTPVLILHLWATWCTPCKEEFPLWRDVGTSLTAQHKGRVRVAHVALQSDSSGMADFVNEMQGKLPFPLEHFDGHERLAEQLRLIDKQMPLPLTLLLDNGRTVRQAFIGPISNRRQELVDATARLVRLVSKVPAAPGRTVLVEPISPKPALSSPKPAAPVPVNIYGID